MVSRRILLYLLMTRVFFVYKERLDFQIDGITV